MLHYLSNIFSFYVYKICVYFIIYKNNNFISKNHIGILTNPTKGTELKISVIWLRRKLKKLCCHLWIWQMNLLVKIIYNHQLHLQIKFFNLNQNQKKSSKIQLLLFRKKKDGLNISLARKSILSASKLSI